MRYLGNDIYEVFTGTRFIELSKEELKTICRTVQESIINEDEDDDETITDIKLFLRQKYQDGLIEVTIESINKIIQDMHWQEINKLTSPKRSYHKNAMIKKLFTKYKKSTKTNKEVFKQISEELKISFKAVEKAFYKKK